MDTPKVLHAILTQLFLLHFFLFLVQMVFSEFQVVMVDHFILRIHEHLLFVFLLFFFLFFKISHVIWMMVLVILDLDVQLLARALLNHLIFWLD